MTTSLQDPLKERHHTVAETQQDQDYRPIESESDPDNKEDGSINDPDDFYLPLPTKVVSRSHRRARKQQEQNLLQQHIWRGLAHSSRRPLYFPVELLERIFAYLSSATLKMVVGCVCKEWRHVSMKALRPQLVWKNLDKEGQETMLDWVDQQRQIGSKVWLRVRMASTLYRQLENEGDQFRYFAQAMSEPLSLRLQKKTHEKSAMITAAEETDVSTTSPVTEDNDVVTSAECLWSHVSDVAFKGDLTWIVEHIHHALPRMNCLRTLVLEPQCLLTVQLFDILVTCRSLWTLKIFASPRYPFTQVVDHSTGIDSFSSVATILATQSPRFSGSVDNTTFGLKEFNVTRVSIHQSVLIRLLSTCPSLRALKACSLESAIPRRASPSSSSTLNQPPQLLLDLPTLFHHASTMCPHLSSIHISLAYQWNDQPMFPLLLQYFPHLCDKSLTLACYNSQIRFPLLENWMLFRHLTRIEFLKMGNGDFSRKLNEFLQYAPRMREVLAAGEDQDEGDMELEAMMMMAPPFEMTYVLKDEDRYFPRGSFVEYCQTSMTARARKRLAKNDRRKGRIARKEARFSSSTFSSLATTAPASVQAAFTGAQKIHSSNGSETPPTATAMASYNVNKDPDYLLLLSTGIERKGLWQCRSLTRLELNLEGYLVELHSFFGFLLQSCPRLQILCLGLQVLFVGQTFSLAQDLEQFPEPMKFLGHPTSFEDWQLQDPESIALREQGNEQECAPNPLLCLAGLTELEEFTVKAQVFPGKIEAKHFGFLKSQASFDEVAPNSGWILPTLPGFRKSFRFSGKRFLVWPRLQSFRVICGRTSGGSDFGALSGELRAMRPFVEITIQQCS